MIAWFRRTTGRAFLGMLVVTACVSAFDYLYAPTPIIRARLPLLLTGAAVGVLIALLTLTAEIGIALFSNASANARREREERFAPRGFPARVGALCFSAVAEEVLFRGYLFNTLLPQGFLWAWMAHAAATLTAFALGRKHLSWTIIRFLQANALLYLFFLTRSLAACIASHLVIEILEMLLLPLAVLAAQKLRKPRSRNVWMAAAIK